jgi:hypothetical protein
MVHDVTMPRLVPFSAMVTASEFRYRCALYAQENENDTAMECASGDADRYLEEL